MPNKLFIFSVLFFITIVTFLPNCGPIKARKEFKQIQQQTKDAINTSVSWAHTADELIASDEIIKQRLRNGITLNDAIAIALSHDPQLQADFEQLGISKSDLVQAGLFTNPNLLAVFDLPKEPTSQADITWELTITLSDFWQVPLRKKVAQDELEITSMRILNRILEVFAQTKIAYTSCLAQQELLANATKTFKESKILRKQVYYRKQFGFESDLDGYTADALVDSLQIDIIKHNKALHIAYSNLRKHLGFLPLEKPIITLTDTFEFTFEKIPSKEKLKKYLLKYHPIMQIAHLKITQARHRVSYEQSRFFKDVQIGFSYEREDDGAKERGPLIGLSVPIFDTNSAQINREKFLLAQAKKDFYAQKNNAINQLSRYYTTLESFLLEIPVYKRIIASYQKGIEYAEKYAKSMQLGRMIGIQTRLQKYEQQTKLIQAKYHALQALANLEQTVGTSIDVLPS